jgi:hypothetical protein
MTRYKDFPVNSAPPLAHEFQSLSCEDLSGCQVDLLPDLLEHLKIPCSVPRPAHEAQIFRLDLYIDLADSSPLAYQHSGVLAQDGSARDFRYLERSLFVLLWRPLVEMGRAL